MASVFIPPKTAKLIRELGLSESIVLDVFHHGQQRPGTTKIYRKYSGYSIQITFIQKPTGEYVITWVSKW